jgi:hypothetical protein
MSCFSWDIVSHPGSFPTRYLTIATDCLIPLQKDVTITGTLYFCPDLRETVLIFGIRQTSHNDHNRQLHV